MNCVKLVWVTGSRTGSLGHVLGHWVTYWVTGLRTRSLGHWVMGHACNGSDGSLVTVSDPWSTLLCIKGTTNV